MAVTASTGVHQFSALLSNGEERPLSAYKGQALLIANVASECGYTRSGYADLVALHTKYAARGLRILAFPCNQVVFLWRHASL